MLFRSLLSASFHTMKSLKWKYGSTKSLVVLTDANFLSPDRDGTTLDEVVRLSKNIDPVNFYIITNPMFMGRYVDMAEQTDGKVVSILGELNLLTDHIIERYDSLPRVEESDPLELPRLEIKEVEQIDGSSVNIKFSTTGTKTLIMLNDSALGVTGENEVTISGLKSSMENNLLLIPLNDSVRGESTEINLDGCGFYELNSEIIKIPKAPNTGRN